MLGNLVIYDFLICGSGATTAHPPAHHTLSKSAQLLSRVSSCLRVRGLWRRISSQRFVSRYAAEEFGEAQASERVGSGGGGRAGDRSAAVRRHLVVCTQPRAMAATTVAQRVAEEFDGRPAGASVGFETGRGRAVKGSCIMFTTDATLVRWCQRDPDLSRVAVVVVDEAHERSMFTDVIVGATRQIAARSREGGGGGGRLHVVIASATIDPAPFLRFFSLGPNATALCVPGRTFPVDLQYRPLAEVDLTRGSLPALVKRFVVPAVIRVLKEHPEGHALVFLPGQAEVTAAVSALKSNPACPNSVFALQLYGSLPPADQNLVMQFHARSAPGERMVCFTTNVAETSLTVPGVRIVVDTGLAREARFDTARRMTVLELVRVSRSSADQRKGRAGRTAPGLCVRLCVCMCVELQSVVWAASHLRCSKAP